MPACLQHGPDAHASALADVHMSLGDLSTEKEDFELAVEEYQKCLDLLQAMPEPDLRRCGSDGGGGGLLVGTARRRGTEHECTFAHSQE